MRLLTYCYGEFYDESLAKEAHEIINTWDETGLSLEQAEIAEELKGFEENQYPWEELEEIGSWQETSDIWRILSKEVNCDRECKR